MVSDIKRKTEIFICDFLSNAISTHSFVPFTGGSNSQDAGEMEPPFTVVVISEAERTHAQAGTWIVRGTVQVITIASESTSAAHSTLVRNIYQALGNIRSDATDPLFSMHGLDISKMTSAQDGESHAHADVISFTAGVGG